MISIPLEWVPLFLVVVILCYLCQFIGLLGESEKQSQIRSEQIEELRKTLLQEDNQRKLLQMIGTPFSDGAFLEVRTQKVAILCDACGQYFIPQENESGISKCPHCDKGYIL